MNTGQSFPLGKFFVSLIVMCGLGVSGCTPCLLPDAVGVLFVSGTVEDAETLVPINEFDVSIRLFSDGTETGFETGVVFGDLPTPGLPPPAALGDFVTPFVSDRTRICDGPFGPLLDPPEFPRPDRIEITVLRASCETTRVIEVNEDTVVDLNYPNDTLQLKESILVPVCAEDGPTLP